LEKKIASFLNGCARVHIKKHVINKKKTIGEVNFSVEISRGKIKKKTEKKMCLLFFANKRLGHEQGDEHQ
jgi:hypothetical protein